MEREDEETKVTEENTLSLRRRTFKCLLHGCCRPPVDAIQPLRLVTAVKTPYLPNGGYDLEAYDRLVNMQIAAGIEGIIIGGTTGEGQLMGWDEQVMFISRTVKNFGDRVKVIGNTGSNCTSDAVKATELGFAAGMDAAMYINPYYCRTSNEALVAHFSAVLPMGPIVIYNIPSRTSQDIPPEVIYTLLAQSPNLAGVKECTGDVERIRDYTKNGITVWTGNDVESYDLRWHHGATGVMSVAANIIPGFMHQLMFEGYDHSALMNEKLKPVFDWLFPSTHPNPIALNTALAQLGVVRPIFRMPYMPLPREKRVEFVKLVGKLGRENFVGDEPVQVLEDEQFTVVTRH
ncbi:4-hydroxy-tetrahydrodipicolinate synthase, chloroplastic [Orobanche minor]